MSIGPRAGINFSNVSNVEGSKSKKGLVLGLTSTYSLNESSGLTLDVLYSVKGYLILFEDHEHRFLQTPFYFDCFFGK